MFESIYVSRGFLVKNSMFSFLLFFRSCAGSASGLSILLQVQGKERTAVGGHVSHFLSRGLFFGEKLEDITWIFLFSGL